MSNVTVIPYTEQYTVVTEDETTAVVVTNSVVVTGNTDLTNYYTKGETDTLLVGKTDVGHQHVVADITDFTNAFINGGAF